jgi:hypothetical protein
MATETNLGDINKEKKRRASAISGGIFLISLGILLFTGWWWPGIMFAIGLSGGAELVFRGKTLRGIATLAFFCAIPFAIWVIQEIEIPWSLVGPLVLIGIGVIVLVKGFYLDSGKV